MDVNFSLGGKTVLPPKEGLDIRIKMLWNDNMQPVVELDETTFVNEHIEIMQNHLDKVGVYLGLDFTMQVSDENTNYLFPGFVDMTNCEFLSPVQWKAPISYLYDLETWNKRFEAISYGYLALEKGMFGQSDYTEVPVIVRKKFDTLEVLFATFGLYIIYKEVREHIKDDYKDIAETIASGFSSPAQVVKSITFIIIKLAYYALMLIALYKLVKTILDNLLPKKTKYKGIKLKTAISKACECFNLTLVTDINEMDTFIYMPSKTDNKTKTNAKDEGIPNVSDYGYQLSEMMELCMKIFNAKPDIKDGKMYFYNEDSEHWRKAGQANILESNIALENYKQNANEMMSNRIISFQYDSSDEWTMPSEKQKNDYTKGTNYQVICDFDYSGDEIKKMNKGLDEISIPLALGKRREKLSAVDVAIKAMAVAYDLAVGLFGGQKISDKVNEHKGALMISEPSFNIPKLVMIDQTRTIPSNHRASLSATALYNNFYACKSFKVNAKRTQHLDFTGMKIPFDFTKFVKYLKSPMFTIQQDGSLHGGKTGKMKELVWSLSADSAIATFYIEEEYNKTQLYEKFIES